MSYLVNLAVGGRAALVVGAGCVAARKVRDLAQAGAKVTVVAPEVCPEIRELAASGDILLHERPYREADLEGAFLVVAATSSEEVNAEISRDAQARGILVNVVDRPALCTFTLPATVKRGALTLAVATEGGCPAFSSVLRQELEERYGPEYGEVTALLTRARTQMVAQGWSSAQIREAVDHLYREFRGQATKPPNS